MNLSRRRFLSVAAAAPVAAPSLADEAMSRGLGAPVPSYYGGSLAQTSNPSDQRSWLLEQKARLERAARGEMDEAEAERMAHARMGDSALDQVDALRSVSRPYKRLMANDIYRRRERESRMLYAKWELRDVLKQLLK